MRASFASAIAALLLAGGAPATVAAQESGAPAAEAEPSPEEVANILRAGKIFRAFSVAMQTEEVSQPVKARLMECIYNNKLSDISAAAGKAIQSDAALSDDNPRDVYRAAAGACGISFEQKDEPATSPESGR